MGFSNAAAVSCLLAASPLIANALSFTPYDLGWYGISPTQHYVSTNLTSPYVNLMKWDPRCEEDGAYVLVSPRGYQVESPGPYILDNRGNLVWTETRFGQVTNLQVQQYRGESYLTFWAGASKGPHSNGSYYLVRCTGIGDAESRKQIRGAYLTREIRSIRLTKSPTRFPQWVLIWPEISTNLRSQRTTPR